MFLPISAIIPVAERPALVQEAIASVLRGTALPQELIVVLSPTLIPIKRECSYPDAPAVESILKAEEIARLSQNRAAQLKTRILFCKRPYVSAARNTGASQAQNPWLAFLDSDDLWHLDKLRKQWEYLKKRPQLKACHSKEKWIRSGSLIKQPVYLQPRRGRFLKAAFGHCLLSCSALLIHRETFQKLGAFDETFEVCEDFAFFLRYLKDFPMGLCQETLVSKRSGDWPQLSKKYHSLDLWRIRALLQFLESFARDLYTDEKEAALAVLAKKINIVKTGALRRKQTDTLKKIRFFEEAKAKIRAQI